MSGILSEIEESRSSQLFLDNQSLLEQFEPPSEKLILDLEEVSFADVHLEWLIDDGEPGVILYVLPSTITMTNDSSQQPVIMTSVPNLKISSGNGRFLLILPERVQFCETTVRDVELKL